MTLIRCVVFHGCLSPCRRIERREENVAGNVRMDAREVNRVRARQHLPKDLSAADHNDLRHAPGRTQRCIERIHDTNAFDRKPALA